MVTKNATLPDQTASSGVKAKARLLQAVRLFEEGDAKGLALLMHHAYLRRKVIRIRDRWFVREDNKIKVCPLAVLIMDFYPRFHWSRMFEDSAAAKAESLAKENLGELAVYGFERGLDWMTREYEITNEYYVRGFELGRLVWCELNCLESKAAERKRKRRMNQNGSPASKR
jgi:hypothetical protein